MPFSRRQLAFITVLLLSAAVAAQNTSSSAHHGKTAPASKGTLDPGWINAGSYHNSTLGLTCKIPDGWVLRTEEMNAPPDSAEKTTANTSARVLLAAFSRPPDAKAEDVNASILIAAESTETYPGMKEAAQYFEPLTEVARAQGFTADGDPYEGVIGNRTLVRGDFHKDVGTRVMRQSTLVMLSHGYAISITIIGGTDDEVEDLIDGLTFTGGK